MTVSEQTIYPRTGDRRTVYLNGVVTDPSILIGDGGRYRRAGACESRRAAVYHRGRHARKAHPQTLF